MVLPPPYVISTRFRISRRAFSENCRQSGQEASSFANFEEITPGDPISCRWLRREAAGGGLHAAARAAAPEFNPTFPPMSYCGPRYAAPSRIFSQFALRDVGETTTCRSNREKTGCARRLPLLATNIDGKVGFGLGFIVRPTMRRLLQIVPHCRKHHLAALSTNPPTTRGQPGWWGTRSPARVSQARISRSDSEGSIARGLESRDCFGIRLASRRLESRVQDCSAMEF